MARRTTARGTVMTHGIGEGFPLVLRKIAHGVGKGFVGVIMNFLVQLADHCAFGKVSLFIKVRSSEQCAQFFMLGMDLVGRGFIILKRLFHSAVKLLGFFRRQHRCRMTIRSGSARRSSWAVGK